jgi:hypothetical protein
VASISDEPGGPSAPASQAPVAEPSALGGPDPRRGLAGRLLDGAVARWARIDGVLYPAFTASAVLYAAVAFYTSLHRQTHGAWSAPLDDVFIHFDYARATARGYPFQWSEGNGFSSGNTSLSYPFVLALGYWMGFRGLSLMHWAAIVACLATFGFLIAAARLTDGLPSWVKYLLPPAVLSLGALDWSLFSGMENAFQLGVWGLTLVATLAVVRAAEGAGFPFAQRARVSRLGWMAGAASALLVVTRPESVVCVASFALFAAIPVRRAFGAKAALFALLRVSLPGAAALGLQSIANRVFTGEWAANGAIAKLALNNPYMTTQEKWDNYVFHLKYVIVRNTQHHFADAIPWGWLVPAVAVLPLLPKRTRAAAILLWTNIAGWLLLVSLNGQVRWQNERYTMSAVAWLLVLAAMGVAVLLSPALLSIRIGRQHPSVDRAAFLTRAAAALVLMAVYWQHQRPNMRDQIWFFGRASRNIRDQHLVAGDILRRLEPRRVLVGDAGALLYASDRPGLDLVGLGGYHTLPFARAGVHGLGASIELIERMPRAERPDLMAIYPSWWGDLPTLFARRITEVPVIGNVICGGAEKVIYRSNWNTLDGSPMPRSIRAGEELVDEIDVADLVSEAEHRYTFPRPAMGFVDFHVLADPQNRGHDLFDAGRIIPQGKLETARARAPRGRGRLVVRTAVGRPAVIEVTADGRSLGQIALKPKRGWIEASLDLPEGLPGEFELGLSPVEGEWMDCHVWILGGAPVLTMEQGVRHEGEVTAAQRALEPSDD